MKKTILFTAAALIASSLFAFDSELLEPRGNVKNYTKTEYSVSSKFGEYFRTVASKHEHTFSDGLRKETTSYTSKDELTDRITYEYNGDRTVASTSFFDASGKLTKKIAYEYADGKIKSETEFNGDNILTAKNIYRYETGRRTESLYNSDGKLINRSIFMISADDKVLEASYYFGDGTLSHGEKFLYTDKGELSAIENLDSDRKKAGKTVFRHDENGFVNEIQIYATDTDLIERDIIKTNADGDPVRISVYSIAEKFGATANELVSITEFTYNK